MKKAILGSDEMPRSSLALKALRQLGPRQLGLYALYQIGLRTGYYRCITGDRRAKDPVAFLDFHPVMKLPDRGELTTLLGEKGQAILLAEADEIVAGRVRLFGGEPVPLQLTAPGSLMHWTEYELGDRRGVGQRKAETDAKFIWEPGRFGWAYTLGRAYHLSGDERYAAAFWDYAETFLEANPAYLGPHWASAQEVALRLIAFVYAAQVFTGSPKTTPERAARLAGAVAAHAARIPPTFIYARAQNNNHLLSEAAGLYTAGVALPDHPSAVRWRELGWRGFIEGLSDQFANDGTYVQHSTNYHRLVLQLTLWVGQVARSQGQIFSMKIKARLGSATHWLLALFDPESGRVPNLGPNDGAYILPLTVCAFEDYRPVLQASAVAFLDERVLKPGPWDEMSIWFGNRIPSSRNLAAPIKFRVSRPQYPIIRHPSHPSWAYLRVARFYGRPGHADQLHLDLWWRGLNVAQDAGTYLYNAPPPWDNALTHTAVHNTLTVNGEEQMTRAGRFLYLDWVQASLVAHERGDAGAWERMVARHDGYRRLGVTHQRAVTAMNDGNWIVEDALLPIKSSLGTRQLQLEACLNWLLPDWPWEVEEVGARTPFVRGFEMRLHSPHGWILLRIEEKTEVRDTVSTLSPEPNTLSVQVVRAGELVYGSGPVMPIWGWSSPTYGEKRPAVALRVTVDGYLPMALTSEWRFPGKGQAGS